MHCVIPFFFTKCLNSVLVDTDFCSLAIMRHHIYSFCLGSYRSRFNQVPRFRCCCFQSLEPLVKRQVALTQQSSLYGLIVDTTHNPIVQHLGLYIRASATMLRQVSNSVTWSDTESSSCLMRELNLNLDTMVDGTGIKCFFTRLVSSSNYLSLGF